MPDSSITLREVFEVPQSVAASRPSEGWKRFQRNVIRDVKAVKTAAMPDLMGKVVELLDVPIPNILLASWNKATALQGAFEESRKSPETKLDVALCDHSIKSEHKPCIEVIVQNATVQKINFTLRLVFKLNGFVLTIHKGKIKQIRTGRCEVKGTMEYEGFVVAERKLAPIELPGSLNVPEGER